MGFFEKRRGPIHGAERGGLMSFIKDFWHTLTTPEEWHTASAVVVGIAGSVLLTLLFINAFDAQF